MIAVEELQYYCLLPLMGRDFHNCLAYTRHAHSPAVGSVVGCSQKRGLFACQHRTSQTIDVVCSGRIHWSILVLFHDNSSELVQPFERSKVRGPGEAPFCGCCGDVIGMWFNTYEIAASHPCCHEATWKNSGPSSTCSANHGNRTLKMGTSGL